MNVPTRESQALRLQRLTRTLGSRREIEEYVSQLNRASPVATRQIARWGGEGLDSMHVAAVAMPERFADAGAFLGDVHTSFALEALAQQQAAAGSPYSVGMVLSGGMRVETSQGIFSVEAGEGIIVDPSQVERSWIEADTRFVEFSMPKSVLHSLGAEGGRAPASLQLEPRVRSELAQRLLFMATEAAQAVQVEGDLLFRRWIEMIGLTLLQEQAATPHKAQDAPPQALRRALDFIEANLQADILLTDVASAACVSVSSLLRLFERHVGRSPSTVLRELRLDRAREELRCGSGGSVRELALRWGFQSPSMFSQAYLRRFGERPSDTRR